MRKQISESKACHKRKSKSKRLHEPEVKAALEWTQLHTFLIIGVRGLGLTTMTIPKKLGKAKKESEKEVEQIDQNREDKR